MKTPFEIEPGFGYGLGLEVSDSPCGRLFGHTGGIPGYFNIMQNSEDGTHQFGMMMNVQWPPAAVWEPLDLLIQQGIREAFAGEPCAAATPQARALQDGQAHRLREDVAVRRPADPPPVLR